MPDIFISYRHGGLDAWAANAIEAVLEKKGYDAFFDRDSIEVGARFDKVIEEALDGCRVVLAVIGPDWSQPSNLVRLRNDRDDWVRREIATALTRRITVVPLLIDCDGVPDDLPEELRILPTLQGMPMSAARLDADCVRLVGELQRWLKQGRGVGVAAPVVVRSLPYLCDRSLQAAELVARTGPRDRAPALLVCVVHGHQAAAHDELLDRFCTEGVIDEALRCVEEGAATCQLQLSRQRLREGRIAEALKSAIKNNLLRRRGSSDAELQAFLAKLSQPLIAVAQLTWSDYQEAGDCLLKQLIEAWRSLQIREDGSIMALSFDALLWINLTYDEPETELPVDVLLEPLPKLPEIVEGDIREWLYLDKVRPYMADRKDRLLAIIKNPEYCHRPGRLHMSAFAEGCRRIMSSD